MTFFEHLEKLDQTLLIFLNHQRTAWLDFLMLHATDKLVWLPFYVFLAYCVYRQFGWRKTFTVFVAIALVITLCDRSSVLFFKDVFKRYRPCHNTLLSPSLVLLDGVCKGKFGFVSSHATNAFGLVSFLALLMPWSKLAKFGLVFWACFVSYTRIYLGVHYPSDIIGGALLGSFWGILVFLAFRWRLAKT